MNTKFHKKITTGIIAAFITASFISAVSAQPPPRRPKRMCEQRFTQMDIDNNGQITLKEFKTIQHWRDNPEKIFALKDTDKNEVLTKKEFCAISTI